MAGRARGAERVGLLQFGRGLPVTGAVTVPGTMNRTLYAIHRWVSLVALVQLGVWLGSGLFFASYPIEEVRGAHVDAPLVLAVDDGAALLSAATALGVARAAGVGAVDRLEIRRAERGPVYIARGPHHAEVRLDARTGAIAPVDRDEAEAIARADHPDRPAVAEARLVEADAPIEYRDGVLPAWRVTLRDGKGTAVWIDARTGDVTARRNDLWRRYDFLWSLHIMDYRGRERFHHPLLVATAIAGLSVVASGATVWLVRLMRRIRRGRPIDERP